MNRPRNCRRCGSTWVAEWIDGVCPACLLEFGLEGYDEGTEPNTSPSPPEEGSPDNRRFGDYQLIGEVASGGMGVVYRALQVRLNRTVALKMIRAGQLGRAEDRARFRAEAETAARLQHPHIVAIYEVGEHAGQPFYSMELIEGRSLAELVRQHPLRPEQAARHVRTIAEAIQYAHERGVLHRDLKPSNIMVDGNDEPHVTDFGLAKLLAADSDLTRSGAVMGSPSYMAPEQAQGMTETVSARSDVYALGAILYELMTGQPPFRASSPMQTLRLVVEQDAVPPRTLNPALPRDLETICIKCLAKSPASRYATAQEIADELGRFLEDKPIRARPAGALEKFARWCRRQPALATAVACSFLLLTALTLVSTTSALRLKREGEATRRAQRNAEEKLLDSQLERARAERLSGVAGRRTRALAAIRAAAQVRPSLQLRNEAIAALALCDLGSPMWVWSNTNHVSGDFAAFDPRLQCYALVHSAGRLTVHRASDHQELMQLPAPAQRPEGVRFSPDGRFIRVNYAPTEAVIWDLEQRAEVFRTGRRASGTHPIFLSGNARLAVITPEGEIWLYTLPEGAKLRTLTPEMQPLWLANGPGTGELAVGCAGEVQLWDADTGRIVRRLHPPSQATCIEWHPDGHRIALGLTSGEVLLWDIRSDRRTTVAAHSSEVSGLGFDPGGERVWSCGLDGSTRCWDAINGSPLLSTWEGLVFRPSPDGSKLAFTIWDHSFGLWPAIHSESVRALHTDDDEAGLANVSLSSDGSWLAVGAHGGWHLLDSATGRTACSVRLGQRVQVAISPDGQSLAGVTQDDVLNWPLIWDTNASPIRVQAGEAQTLLRAKGKELQRLCFSADGTRLAIAGHYQCAVIDLRPGGSVQSFSRGMAQSFVSVSPDHRWLAAADVFGRGATLWDCQSGELVRTLVPQDQAHLAFSADGRTLATMAKDCIFWDTTTWQPRRRVQLPPDFVGGGSLAFSGDSRFVGVVESNRLIKLLNPETGEELATLTPPARLTLMALDISGDGSTVAAVTQGRTIYLWNLRTLRRELAAMGLDW